MFILESIFPTPLESSERCFGRSQRALEIIKDIMKNLKASRAMVVSHNRILRYMDGRHCNGRSNRFENCEIRNILFWFILFGVIYTYLSKLVRVENFLILFYFIVTGHNILLNFDEHEQSHRETSKWLSQYSFSLSRNNLAKTKDSRLTAFN